MKKKTSSLEIVIVIVTGIVLNLLPMWLIQIKLELPLFMDTLGSIFVAFVAGGLPGIICATISQLLMCILEHYSNLIILLYVLTVYGAIGVVCLFRKTLAESDSAFSTAFILFFISIFTIFEMCIVGGLVNAVCIYVQNITGYEVQDNPATSYFQVDLLRSGLSELPTYILSRLPGNLIERPLITVLAFAASLGYSKAKKRI